MAQSNETLRLPILYILTVLGSTAGFFMGYLHFPLAEKVESLEDDLHKADNERTEMRVKIDYLMRKVKP